MAMVSRASISFGDLHGADFGAKAEPETADYYDGCDQRPSSRDMEMATAVVRS